MKSGISEINEIISQFSKLALLMLETTAMEVGAQLMETETLKWGISWMATVSTIGLFLSGISLCLKVKKQGDTKDVTMAPFLVTSANCAFWLK